MTHDDSATLDEVLCCCDPPEVPESTVCRDAEVTAVLTEVTARPAAQQPPWPHPFEVDAVEAELAELPGLTTEDEVDDLARAMASVARGDALVLQGGDCAERFHEAVPDLVRRKVDYLQGLAAMMRAATGLPSVAVGRLAGQYGKPRSSPYEPVPTETGCRMVTYCGDAVNAPELDPALRVPDPRRLRTAYDCARAVLREVRRASRGKAFMERVHVAHELLLMPYERPLVRAGVRGPFSTSTHFGWIGERTRDLTGAHVALAAAVHNPIGVKIGPAAAPDDVVALTLALNPDGVPGRLCLITRYGAAGVDRMLPEVARAVARRGAPAVWVCDPMHGNGIKVAGVKTRSVQDVLTEVSSFVHVLTQLRLRPSGLHLELTPDPVTECVWPQAAEPLFSDYRSTCDPRLNPEQSVAVIAHFLDRIC
ncbi:3-deoxy-7-phosphoheptulonate synthase [Actinokineospora globicatena]|uniref:3-deoxy-7-phosphoheptulonate synthase n=1 Tax=Actinokineospora globicatena TaxID=103729 RepID=UPI0020A43BA2|nr:3-deoxy-7-phosphoheptulonate synthase [Actinokineospora globicatena]MCP2303718.1 3-deoxy-D-arabinoheptulosonate-7-phosphate synthase [Actinokineospora globicatena]GLW79134.1 phospho-2-dehydro-3-deoxyheptonate aldolase [Actinokineospora globicatena]GLW86456.1 phospho-2-dehydro-3-deoxyheptonate aldolase [Actinokineospora globicatena]